MNAMASQFTGVSIVCSTNCSGANKKKNIKAPRHWPLWGNPPVTGGFPLQRASNAKMFPIDDVIMCRGWAMHANDSNVGMKFLMMGNRMIGYMLKLDASDHLVCNNKPNIHCSDVIWALSRPKWWLSQMSVQHHVQTNNKKYVVAALYYRPPNCEGIPPVACGFLWQKESNAKSVSMPWRQHTLSHF